ncbi:MAG: hypothetical protein QOD45_1787 [Pseudonocardiales bacterium]|jgi:hypothetical protein|nr:hypothetical protein [Pseudonocardiales bacterium]
MDLADAADRLYALTPEEFTAERDALAKQARDDGDRDRAAAIKALRRPTVGVWLVNALARQRSGHLDELAELGASLRAAQDALAGDDMRRLSQQRQRLVRELVAEAADLAEAAGLSVSDPARRETEATLHAALADEAAADAARSGRLMRALSSSGLEPVDLSGAVVDAAAIPMRRPSTPPRRTRAERLAQARQAVRAARSSAQRAERAAAKAERAGRDAQLAHAETQQRVAEVEAELKRARADTEAAAVAVRTADAERVAADRERDAAHAALHRAETALARIVD